MLWGRIGALGALLATIAACLQITTEGISGRTTGGETTGSTYSTTGGHASSSAGSTGGPVCSPPCGANATCNPQDNTCNCYPGYSPCPGTGARGAICTQKLLDNNNCGGCGNVCSTGEGCLGGACICRLTTCPLPDGGSTCTDTSCY